METKIISAFEQNVRRIKRLRKHDRSDVVEALLAWFKQQKSGRSFLMLIFVLFKCQLQVTVFLVQSCTEIYNYKRIMFILFNY